MRRALGAMAALAVLACACQIDPRAALGKPVPARGGQATEAIVGSAEILNPLFAREDNARDIDSLVYQGLTGAGPDQQPVPALAKEWTVSSDGLVYTFDVRNDVRWGDGQPFTVEDVLFTFAVLQDPSYNQPGGEFWRQIAIAPGSGPQQVKFTLKAPSASFPSALSIGIIAKHLFKDPLPAAITNDAHSAQLALGTGPFVVESISRDHRTVALKRNRYAVRPPFLDRFVFRSYPTADDAVGAVLSGQADAIGDVLPPQLPLLANRRDLEIHDLRTFTVVGMMFGLTPENVAFLEPVAVRHALVQAVDRKKLIDEVLRGRAEPAPGPIPPDQWAFARPQADKYQYDPRAAAAALEANGWTVGTDGVRAKGDRRFSVEMVAADAYPYRNVAQAVADQLKQVGVEVRVTPVPASTLVNRYLIGRHFQLALAAFDNGPDPDEFTLWHTEQPADSVAFGGLLPRQALIDKDLEDGRAALDRRSRLTAYADFQELMSEAAPAVFLYEPHYSYVVSRRIRGVQLSPVVEPVDRFAHVADWYELTRVR
jgi:peptide/nickel transport system substrate-binding protein